ncbi:hypothetical protein U7230_03110 [Carboxydochorda subterranea]|uniref:YvlB/LiaX N-terminal domain-containing protein n=1 Tax=Carboxydichorda subterranea TaxID=3109565 RepID=A0ABZ1BYY4_9FIRM|nr:hypothetical protein [Limnochorda sp. L945t]WRP18012.1 hypothetical protein U7230_03110 [Limnochorda sp. L945t]
MWPDAPSDEREEPGGVAGARERRGAGEEGEKKPLPQASPRPEEASPGAGKAAPSGGTGEGEPSDDRLRILRMVEAGRLRPEEALRLLEALAPAPGAPGGIGTPGGTRAQGGAGPRGGEMRGRTLQIRVFEEGEDRMRLNIPIALAHSALRLVPRSAARHLEGIDLKELLAQIEWGAYGKILEVRDEDDTGVEIVVE